MKRFQLSDLPARSQAEVLAQLKSTPHPRTVAIALADAPAKPRIRQNSRGLNKTEQAFFDWLKMRHPGLDVGSQRIRVKLANGAWYKPDNDIQSGVGRMRIYEVKGHMRPKDALTLKVAAQQFPHMQFFLVTAKDRALTGWEIQEVRQ